MDIRGLIQRPGMGGSSIPGLGGGMGGAASPMTGGYGAFGGQGATGTTVIGQGGGMDVMGSLKKNSDFATSFVGNPGGW